MTTIKQIALRKALKVKDKFKNLSKKNGDDKLVISLVLIVIGCVLCFLYRDKVTEVMSMALTNLSTKLQGLFNNI